MLHQMNNTNSHVPTIKAMFLHQILLTQLRSIREAPPPSQDLPEVPQPPPPGRSTMPPDNDLGFWGSADARAGGDGCYPQDCDMLSGGVGFGGGGGGFGGGNGGVLDWQQATPSADDEFTVDPPTGNPAAAAGGVGSGRMRQGSAAAADGARSGGPTAIAQALRFGRRSSGRLSGEGWAADGSQMQAWQHQGSRAGGSGGGRQDSLRPGAGVPECDSKLPISKGPAAGGGGRRSVGRRLPFADAGNSMQLDAGGAGKAMWEQQAESPDPDEVPAAPAPFQMAAGAAAEGTAAGSAAEDMVQQCESVFSFL